MMREYRRDLQHSYLVMHSDDLKIESGYVIRMITENAIPGLLACSCKRIDERILYYYDVTSQISLKERLSHKKISGEEMLLLLNCLVAVLNNIDEYLLTGDSICLELDCIFVDAQMENINFCYFPEHSGQLDKNIQKLFEELLPFLDHENPESVQIGYDIFHYLMKVPFSLDGLKEQLCRLRKIELEEEKYEKKITVEENQCEKDIEKEIDLQSVFRESEQDDKNSHVFLIVGETFFLLLYILSGWYLWNSFRAYISIWVIAGVLLGCVTIIITYHYSKKTKKHTPKAEDGMLEKETTGEYMSEESLLQDNSINQDIQTSILCENKTRYGYILEEKYTDIHRKYEIKDCEVQIIGRLYETADIVLEFPSISRIHARLRKENSRFFISDMNSRNGTWVNGKELVGMQEVEICVGDEIRFAEGLYCLKKI